MFPRVQTTEAAGKKDKVPITKGFNPPTSAQLAFQATIPPPRRGRDAVNNPTIISTIIVKVLPEDAEAAEPNGSSRTRTGATRVQNV